MSSQEDINPDSSPDSPSKGKDAATFEPKPQPKMIRVLTVLAYVLSVSMAAILLSIYYIFMWDGKPHIGARRAYDFDRVDVEEMTAQPERVYSFFAPKFAKYMESPPAFEEESQKPPHPLVQLDVLNVSYDVTTSTASDYQTGQQVNNYSALDDENYTNTEMQQQITAKEVPLTSTPSTTTEDDYDNFEEFRRSSTFMKRLVYKYDGNY